MTDDDLVKLADSIYGLGYDRKKMFELARAVRKEAFQSASRIAKGMLKEHELDILQVLKTSAEPNCEACDGTGIFYGNVCICACALRTAEPRPADPVERIIQDAIDQSVLEGIEKVHDKLMADCLHILDTYRQETPGLAGVKYWYHPESSCVFTTGTPSQEEGLAASSEPVEEISHAQYMMYLNTGTMLADDDNEL